MTQSQIRNFCIIAHIDHGKSTLADRFLELTHRVERRDMQSQFLDQMDLERERGITIKLQPVCMQYPAADGTTYTLNLIDTPGHVDFSYEVSRSLAACEGAILVVDATQGIQAQTIAHVYQAIEQGLEIIPVVNKIDLPNAQPDQVKEEIEKTFGFSRDEILEVSGKIGTGVDKLLEAVVSRIPAPQPAIDPQAPARSLIFDSVFDTYQGIILYVRQMTGTSTKNDLLHLIATNTPFTAQEVGIFTPLRLAQDRLEAGQIGYIVTGLKDIAKTRVGDTVALSKDVTHNAVTALPGYKKVQPLVYSGLYCVENNRFDDLKYALSKLQLNDSSLYFESRHSQALGFGFFCGFLGLLHLEITKERLQREYDLDVIITSPTVPFRITPTAGEPFTLYSPEELPRADHIKVFEELWCKLELVTPVAYIGSLMELCQEKQAVYKNTNYLNQQTVIIEYEIPLRNVITDFYDQLKSRTQGYASLNYEVLDFRPSDLVRVDILVNEEQVDPFSMIVHRSEAEMIGRRLAKKLKELIPRHQFQIPIQAVVGGKIVARETIGSLHKDVTAKLYGGDVTRKHKLLDKQRKGKKRMRAFGKVDIPHQAFLDILKN